MASDIFKCAKCTFYKSVVDFKSDRKTLVTPGKIVSILDVLSKEGYTNFNLLNELRASGYKSKFYDDNKRGLSAALFSSVQDDLTITRSDKNNLYHTGFLTFDIDPDQNQSLFTKGGTLEMFEFLMDIPEIAYLGRSVSGIGLWGLIPIDNPEDHYGQFRAMVSFFKEMNINVDSPLRDISRVRFIAFDPDAYFNFEAKRFERTEDVAEEISSDRRIRPPHLINDELFWGAVKWVELKYTINFQQGSRHNFLLCLYGTLYSCGIPEQQIKDWIYEHLIPESDIQSNCLVPFKNKNNAV